MSIDNRQSPTSSKEMGNRSIALKSGFESALIGLSVTLVFLVLSYLLQIADIFYRQCFSMMLVAFAALGALAGYWSYRRGARLTSQVVLAGAISGLVSGSIMGNLALFLFSAVIPFPNLNVNFDLSGALGSNFGGIISLVILMGYMTVVMSPLGAFVGCIGALGMRTYLNRASMCSTDEPSLGPMSSSSPATSRAHEPNFLPHPEEVPGSLRPALHLIREGKRAEARPKIAQYLMSNLNDESAWVLMAHTLEDPVQKRESLERALAINPGSRIARQMLDDVRSPPLSLDKQGFPPPSEALQAIHDRADELSAEAQQKRNLMITTIGVALAAIVPILVLVFNRYKLKRSIINPIVIVLASVFGFLLGYTLEERGRIKLERSVFAGALNGVGIALMATFTSAFAYHAVFLPMRSDHTRLQGILAWIGGGLFGAVILGVVFGGGSAVAASYLRPVAGMFQARLRAAAPHNAWAALWLAYSADDATQKRYFVDQALALQPSNLLALRLKQLLEAPKPEVRAKEPASAGKSVEGRFRLPPLATTEMGRRFIIRAAITLGLLSACSVCGNLFGVGGSLLKVTTTLLVVLFIFLGAGFLLWLLVQALRR